MDKDSKFVLWCFGLIALITVCAIVSDTIIATAGKEPKEPALTISGTYASNDRRIEPPIKASFVIPVQDAFIDEAQIPSIEQIDGESAAEALSRYFPRIIIDGYRLEYDADSKNYIYAGTDQRAVWIEVDREGEAPERILCTPTRKGQNGEYQSFDGKQWRTHEEIQ